MLVWWIISIENFLLTFKAPNYVGIIHKKEEFLPSKAYKDFSINLV